MSSGEEPMNKEHFFNMILMMEERRDEFHDIVLIAGRNEQRIPAHRLMLSAGSAYFKALFASQMLEANQYEVRVGDVHGDYLLPLVKYCYHGKLDITVDTVDYLLKTASFLQINGAIIKCCEFVGRYINIYNCLSVFVFAEQLSLNSTKKKVEDFICDNFQEVCQIVDFLNLEFKYLAELIGNDYLTMPSEESVFHCVMAWVNHDAYNRKVHIPQLLALVRLKLLEPTFLRNHVLNICIENGCQHLLDESNGTNTMQRKSMDSSLLILSSRHSYNIDGIDIDTYDEVPTHFGKIGRRHFFAAAKLNNEIIIAGDCTNFTEAHGSVESFDLDSKTSTELQPMQTARYSFGVAVLKGCLYAVGGRNDKEVLNSVERYDPESQTWSYVASMSVVRNLFKVAVLDGLLYATGGYDGSNYLASTESYNSHTNKWTQRANLNQGRAQFGLAANYTFLYVVGGSSCNDVILSSVERYDLKCNQWIKVCSLIEPRFNVCCVFYKKVLWAIGGSRNDTWTNAVEKYDEQSNNWIQIPPFMTQGTFIRTVIELKQPR